MDEIVFDPVDQKAIKKSEAFAHHNGLYFGSFQTQQMYYNLLEKGFEVVYSFGKPMLWPMKHLQRWNKEINLKQSAITEEERGLQEGDYTLKLELGKHRRKTRMTLLVTSGDGISVLQNVDLSLSKENPIHIERFAISEEHANAVLRVTAEVEGKSMSMVKRSVVECSLEFLPVSKTKKELSQARHASKLIALPGEHVVELSKRATGLGIALGWDPLQRSVFVQDIKENSSADQSNLQVGDRIIGVQGERVNAMSLEQVATRIRNVPMTVVLVVANKPKGHRPAPTAQDLREILSERPNPAPLPPRPREHKQRTPPPVPARPNLNAPAIPPRPIKQNLSTKTPLPPRPKTTGHQIQPLPQRPKTTGHQIQPSKSTAMLPECTCGTKETMNTVVMLALPCHAMNLCGRGSTSDCWQTSFQHVQHFI